MTPRKHHVSCGVFRTRKRHYLQWNRKEFTITNSQSPVKILIRYLDWRKAGSGCDWETSWDSLLKTTQRRDNITMLLWRNWLARLTVNQEVGGYALYQYDTSYGVAQQPFVSWNTENITQCDTEEQYWSDNLAVDSCNESQNSDTIENIVLKDRIQKSNQNIVYNQFELNYPTL
ncbi:hypothetical protein G6F56_009981 [Rhizopus delemar]|nr:hypothetical protein G6F56_009981 [Rhizopus delemar]